MGVKKTGILILLSKSLCGTSQVTGYSRRGGGAAQVIDFQSLFFKTMNPQSDSQIRTDPREPNRPALLNVGVAGPFRRPRTPKGPGPVFPPPLEPALGVPQGPGCGDPRSPLSRHREPLLARRGAVGRPREAAPASAHLAPLPPRLPRPAPAPRRRDAGSTGRGVGALTFCTRSAPPPSPPGGSRRARGEHGGVRGRPPRVLRVPHARGPRAGRCGPRGAGGAPGRRGGGVRSLRGRLGRARALSGERRLRRAGDGGGDPVQPTGGVGRDGVGQRCGAPTARRYLRPPSQPGYCMHPGWPPPRPAAPPRPRLLLLGHAPPAGLRPPQVGGGGSAGPTHVNWTNQAGGGVEREKETPRR